MTINLDQYINTLNVTDTATNADLTFVPKGTGQTKATNSTSSIMSSVGQSGYGSFLAQGSTGNAAYYFGYSGSSEVGRITMSGATDFGTSSAATLQLRVSHTASAVNYVQVTGNATGGGPSLSAQGSDSNASLVYIGKGIGGHVFTSGNGANIQIVINNTTSAVNYHQFTGSTTGNAVVHSAAGSDTNIDLAFTPKGTGNVRFGTYTGTILTPTGYVEIKDSGGTVRRLLVG